MPANCECSLGECSGEPLLGIGSDHGGWRLKEELKRFLLARGFRILDFGRPDEQPVDYPEVALATAAAVSRGEIPRAILICGTGLGMTILANKVAGVRACLCHDTYSARMSRAHNDCNMLTLGGRVIGTELAKEIVAAWLEAGFEGGRHERRLGRIREVERSWKIQGDPDGKPVAE